MHKRLIFVDERETYATGRDEQVLCRSDNESFATMTKTKPALRSNGIGSSNQWMVQSDEYSLTDDEQEPFSDGTVLNRLLSQWAEVAVSHAVVREINDPPGLIATVAGIDGAWGFAGTPEEALTELRSVLIDWARLKLEDGDEDIPSMEGVHLVLDE